MNIFMLWFLNNLKNQVNEQLGLHIFWKHVHEPLYMEQKEGKTKKN